MWKERSGKEGKTEETSTLASLDFGARIAKEAPACFMKIVSKEAGEEYFDYVIFPELAIPSPDGQHLAIMTHTFSGEYSDTFSLKLEPSSDFAFAAYHSTALGLLKTKPARAAELLASATEIKPKSWKAQHNLACAFALAGEPDKAKDPLTKSVEAGGAKAIAKAKSDADLESVRALAWFADVVK